jgi:hypothetical protein
MGDVGGPQFANYGDTGFGPIGGYPTLPNLYPNGAPTLPSVTAVPNTSANSGYYPQFLQNAANTVQSGINSATSTGGFLKSILNIDLEDLIFIVLGLLLITAGVFSFKQTQTIIREGGRAAATAAAAA